ncbi:MAG: carbohydrate kinase family protein [Lachnospiraceae bacterium]|jgi:sugar/nucleoside kinase (ribokinase family)|nr:carbohydrate kinase family protein [Lachnospiraceae bacterium]
MERRKKIIAAGHICIDITPAFPSGKGTEIGRVLMPGKLLHVGKADVHTGGSVANTGLAMKILGEDVSLMGKIGTDEFGDLVMKELDRYAAGSGMIRVEGETTSYSIVLAIPGIDRIFLHDPGANDTFRPSDVPDAALADAVLFHFGYPPIMAAMYENDGAALQELMRKAQQAGCVTSLDLAAVDPDSPAGRADWKRILAGTLPFVDFFVPSAEELLFMLDRDKYDRLQERAAGRDLTEVLDREKDIRPLAEECFCLGAKTVLIKCGVPGLYFRSSGAAELVAIAEKTGLDAAAWCDQDCFEKSYRPDRVLSGTGAGDTSIAAFLTAMLRGYGPEDALHLAAAEGASCVEAYDALSGLRKFDELLAKIQGGWEKI